MRFLLHHLRQFLLVLAGLDRESLELLQRLEQRGTNGSRQ